LIQRRPPNGKIVRDSFALPSELLEVGAGGLEGIQDADDLPTRIWNEP
jgi:hypothetical protein